MPIRPHLIIFSDLLFRDITTETKKSLRSRKGKLNKRMKERRKERKKERKIERKVERKKERKKERKREEDI